MPGIAFTLLKFAMFKVLLALLMVDILFYYWFPTELAYLKPKF